MQSYNLIYCKAIKKPGALKFSNATFSGLILLNTILMNPNNQSPVLQYAQEFCGIHIVDFLIEAQIQLPL